MKSIITILLILLNSFAFAQKKSEAFIQDMALEVNRMKGKDLGNGVIVKGVVSLGRTLFYQFDVPENWLPFEGMKEMAINNLKEQGTANMFFIYDINVVYQYYYGSKLLKQIRITSNELSDLYFELGEYLSINGHPKSKGINMQIKTPEGWEVKDGNKPNIVKQITYSDPYSGLYNMFQVMTKENMMFMSRNEAQELLSDDEYINGVVLNTASILQEVEIISKKVMTLDQYPTIKCSYKGYMDMKGSKLQVFMTFWMVFYEDKFVLFQSINTSKEGFEAFKSLNFRIANSVTFPDQYK